MAVASFSAGRTVPAVSPGSGNGRDRLALLLPRWKYGNSDTRRKQQHLRKTAAPSANGNQAPCNGVGRIADLPGIRSSASWANWECWAQCSPRNWVARTTAMSTTHWSLRSWRASTHRGTVRGGGTSRSAPITFLAGSDDQKQRYIPKLASGEWIGSWALTEPESGSDAGGTHTRRCSNATAGLSTESTDIYHHTPGSRRLCGYGG